MKSRATTYGALLLLSTLCLVTPDTLSFGPISYHVAINGNDSSSGTEDYPWRTIAKANSTLQAGDTVYIRAGTYEEAIQPARSGTMGQRITYASYSDEKVLISNINDPLILSGRSHVTIKGIEFRGVGRYLNMVNGHYNHIEYCTFAESQNWRWAGMDLRGGSSYNWIHHNSISGHGDFEPGGDDWGDMIYLDGSYNLLENNEIFHGGHTPLGVLASYNVIRNNYFHNEVWRKGYGDRCMLVERTGTGHTLIEGNRFAFARLPCDQPMACGIQMSASDNIVRYNLFYENEGNGLKITTFGDQVANNNRVYNNVFFHNGVLNTREKDRYGLKFNAWGNVIVNNVAKNNIFYRNVAGPVGYGGNVDRQDQVIANNWTSGDPLFVDDESSLDPFNPSLPDFHLRAGSDCIDAGTHLTEANGSGSGTTLTVDDPMYFSDGFGIERVEADWIKIGNGDPVQIQSVNYDTDTITLKGTRSWLSQDPVYLYKNSSGDIVFRGPAPDIGAYESTVRPVPTPTSPPAYHYGDVITLWATGDTGWSFAGWGGDLPDTANPVTVTITSNTIVTATFTQDEYTLMINTIGNGTVTVQSTRSSRQVCGPALTTSSTHSTTHAHQGLSSLTDSKE